MAISFSRPDPSSPAAVAEASFGTSRKGFDPAEVREFLRMVSAELGRLQERERFLERELRSAQAAPGGDVHTIDEETATRLLGEETARILTAAREGGASIKAKAEDAAAKLLKDATDDATRLRQEAELEAARRRRDATADAEAELAMAKQQGREMVEEARAYRERVLGELARRRELARQQIEQLVSGRDRLVQVFERARLVAGEIVGDLAPLDPPEELVDLSPTTGPVPLTVPNARLGDRSAVDDAPMPGEARLGDDEPDHPFVRDATAEAEAEPEPEPVAEPEAVAEAEPEAVADAEVAAHVDPVAEVEIDEGTEPQVEVEPVASNVVSFPSTAVTAGEDTEVDQIFARLRAGRPEPATPVTGDAVPVDGVEPVDEAEPETPFAAREAIIVPLMVAAARKLKRRLADEQNEILDALRRNEPVTDADALVGTEDEQVARYADAVTAELAAAADAGATAIGGTEPIDLGPEGPLAPAREAIATELVGPLRERLARAVTDADGDHDTIAKKVRGLYREWKSQRIDDELDDVVRGAYTRAAYASLTPGTQVRWIVDPDGPASPDCEDNSLAEPVAVGDGFPTGHTNPPAHPGCRCLLAVVDS